MSRASRMMAGAAALSAALLLSACAGPGGFAGGSAPAVLTQGVDCLAPNLSGGDPVFPGTTATPDRQHPEAPLPGEVPTGFLPVTAVRCSFLGAFDDERGRWSAVTVETLTGDFGRLVSALAEPDDQPQLDQACTLEMESVPELWLLNASGEAMRVSWPVTACNKTKPGTHEVLSTFTVTQTDVIPVTLLHSREAIDAGCAMQASVPLVPGLAVMNPGERLPVLPDATGTDDDGATVVPPQAAQPTTPVGGLGTVCFYDVDPPSSDGLDDIPGWDGGAIEGLLTIVSGQFSGAGTVPADAAARARAAASGAAPVAAECALVPTRFAVLDPEPYDRAVTVELDGCGRLVVSSGAAYDTPATVAAALVG
ncbi:MAG: hypothetical protein R6W83_05100 [Cryobacterium sp.]